MKQSDLTVLFLGKKDDRHCEQAVRFCRSVFRSVTAELGGWGDPLPEAASTWSGDVIVSYLSRWVVPERLLAAARVAAINFHPAPPSYPGIGCNNFALYDGAEEYGVTCHHMAARVDTGPIIAVSRFPVFASDDVASLLERTYDHQLVLFYDVVGRLARGAELPASEERWTRAPFTRKEFNQLGKIVPGMSREEIARRVRATSFRSWGPTLELEGFVFELKRQPSP